MLGGTINASADDTTTATDGSATNESTTGEPANSGNEVTLTPAASKESTATGTPVESNSGSTATPQSTPQSTAATLMAEAATKDHLANNKISISNVRVNKSEVVESQGLDITFSFDWTGQGLEKGDMLVTPLTDGFTSITRQVETPFGANGQQMGIMVLDYDAKQIVTKFTADMDPNKIYSGTINIATFVDRDYFKNVENSVDHTVTLADGKTAQVKFDVIFDVLQQNPDVFGVVSLYAKESKDNADQSTDIKWASVVNKAQNEMTDAIIYLSPDQITGVAPEFQTPGDDRTAWTNLGIKYDENQTYVIDPATIKVYKATVYDSMGYAKQQELKEGSDYKITHSELNPHAYTVELLGDYATTKDQFVIEYGGNVKNSVGDRTQVNHTTSDGLVAYYTGRVLYGQGMDKYYAGRINLAYSGANISVNNSSINGVTDEDVTGSVTVVHIDASTGNILKKEAYVVGADGTLLKNAKQGTPYATEPEKFPGFKYTMMGYNSDPKSGEVKQGLQRVIYLYMPEATKKGSVDVTYIAEDGTVLEKTFDVVKDGEIGSDYTTTEKEFDGYHFVRMGEFSADAAGQVAEGTKHVVYVYAKNPEKPVEKKGSVDVKYITKDGQVLEDVSSVKDNAPVGEDYTTEEKSFDGYHFVGMDKTSDPATGVVAEGDKHVIYVYEKDVTPEVKHGNVDVTYVAEDGTVLEATSDVVKDGEIGSDYTTTEKEFDGYHFVRMGEFSADAAGQVAEGTKHVVYVYAKNPEKPVEKKGSVDVKYITKDGQVLEDVSSVKDNAPVGEDYTTEEKSFDGYHFVGMDKSSDPATGIVSEGDKHVIYVYEKDVTPEVKKGNVDVTYLAEDGTVLQATKDVAKDAEVGTAYTTTPEVFDGYHFARMGEFSADVTGQVEAGTKHVVYIYAKNPATPVQKTGSVDVKYVTTDGEVLSDVTSVKDHAPVGEDYTTEEKSFEGYHFVGMDKSSDPATGIVSEGTKHVIYVYEKDPVKHGSVDVTYVAEDGTVLAATTDVVKDGELGTTYTTAEKTFDGYHFVRMGDFSAAATGQVIEGVQHVIYVYAKNEPAPVPEPEPTPDPTPTPTPDPDPTPDYRPGVEGGSVTVEYVDENGNPLPGVEKTTVKDKVPVGEAYTTEEKTFEGYHFVRMGDFSAAATGQVIEGVQHVIYVYAKNEPVPDPTPTPTPDPDPTPDHKPGVEGGSVTVEYVDENGNPLPGGEKTTVKDKAPVGEAYTTEEKTFEGYHFVGMGNGSATPSGQVQPGEQHVVYVYTKDTPTPTSEPTPQPQPETTQAPQPEVTPTSVAPTTTPSQPAAPATAQSTLPQTGNDDQPSAMAGIGLAGLGLLSALAWGRKKKRSTK